MTQTKKMKTFKNLCLLFALMLGIAACGKEAQDAPQALEATRSEEGKSLHVGSRDSIVVNFTIGADSEELRLAQSVNAEGVPFNPFMEEKDVVIRFAVRKSNRVTYTDAVCKKIPGENKASYKGVIRLPDLGYGNTTPTDLTGHEIAGILLGEANGGTQFVETVDANTVKTIEQTELLTAENDVVRSKVPYILDWTAFPLTAQGVQTSKQTLHFKPVGNLLRIQLNNQYTEAKTLESFKISTNAFVTQAKFDFSTTGSLSLDISRYNSNIPTTASGIPTQVLSTTYNLEKSYSLSTPIHIEPESKSRWYYLWVMPLVYSTESITNRTINLNTQVIGVGNDNKTYNMISLCSPLLEGSNSLKASLGTSSSDLNTAFKGGKLPLWYVADYDVAPDGKSFTNKHDLELSRYPFNKSWGFFTSSELSNIDISGYYVPENYDYSAVFGISHDPRTNSGFSAVFSRRQVWMGYPAIPVITEPERIYRNVEYIRFPGESTLIKTLAIYNTTDPYTIYALRFDEECGRKNRLTAYRYEIKNMYVGADEEGGDPSNIANSFNTGLARLVVSSKFLGPAFTGNINTISNPTFWASNEYSAGSVSRIFPMVHEYQMATITSRLGKDVQINLNTWEQSMGIRTYRPGTYNTGEIKHPVRLFKNEFKTAQ